MITEHMMYLPQTIKTTYFAIDTSPQNINCLHDCMVTVNITVS